MSEDVAREINFFLFFYSEKLKLVEKREGKYFFSFRDVKTSFFSEKLTSIFRVK